MDNGEKLLRMAEIGCSATRTYTKTCGLGGATEHAVVENAIRAKLQGWKMQEWKKREQIAGVENGGVSRMQRQPEIILRQP